MSARSIKLRWPWRAQVQGDEAAHVGAGAPLLVAFASQSGFAETIAWRTAEGLRAGGRIVQLLSLEALTPQALSGRNVLFVVSTTGSGEAPDSARAFVRQMRGRIDLLQTRYLLLALGDRSYEQFCGFGVKLDGWLRAGGAQAAAPMICVDNGDIAAIERWRGAVAQIGGLDGAVAWTGPAFHRCRLTQRTLLNPGSPGAPLFHLVFSAVEGPLTWAAGDIAEIFPGKPGDMFASVGPDHRDYTLASVPSDGALEVVVRQMRFADGRLGGASRWLTEECAVGDQSALRIRENSSFHAPPPDQPMILIGNGSGIAGLRAHLKARKNARAHRNWLFFGERTRAHDFHFADEIGSWRQSGCLPRLDLAFSRDEASRAYVQDLLAPAAEELRAWLADGAAIYVCGGAMGMAGGVEQALTTLMGAEQFAAWAETGRYRRDVY